jgi:formylglycine-generating enzyme required for sulfatase activity/predicted Ser/Thr protein kinase
MTNNNQQLRQGTALSGQKYTYTIERVLGQGGFGITYLATMSVWVQGPLGGKVEAKANVAIKEFFMKDYCERDSTRSPHITVSNTSGRDKVDYYRNRFNKEARNVSKLAHEHIVKVLEVFEANNTTYIAMEYIDGESLAAYVRSRGALSEAEAVGYIRQIAEALDYTHSRKITHLDLKPLNILRQNDGTIKVIDFGLSKQYDVEGTVESSSVDAAGITEGYSAFELYDRGSMEKFSPETDIYSLGATLYFMLTGSTPPSAPQLIRRFPIPDSVSPRMATVIRQAMQPDKENRPQSIAAFVALLNGGVPDEDTKDLQKEKTQKLPDEEKEPDVIVVVDPPTPPAPPSSSGKRSLIWTGVIAAVIVFVLGIFFNPFGSPPVDKGDDAGDTVIARVDSTPVSIPPVAPKPTPTPVVEPAAPTTHRIIGRIYSSADNAGITGVTVSVKGTKQSTRTDNDGRFSLDEVPLTAQRISLSKSGYTTQEVAIESNMLVEMNPVVKSPPVVAETPQSGGNNPRQSLEPEMVFVQGGTFTMGSPISEPERSSNEVQHQVTVSSFQIGKYEVTQGQWKAVMGDNPSYYKKGDNYPVENVSWDDIQTYLQKLNAATGKNYRLPTEAEWEYASRGGNRSNGYIYSGSNNIDNVAWYMDNSGSSTHPVGQKSPNELGIYDMSGNVWEWCSDWYGSYSTSAQTNPKGPSSGSYRVYRGGSWHFNAKYCRSANRFINVPGSRNYFLGFRVAASASF